MKGLENDQSKNSIVSVNTQYMAEKYFKILLSFQGETEFKTIAEMCILKNSHFLFNILFPILQKLSLDTMILD